MPGPGAWVKPFKKGYRVYFRLESDGKLAAKAGFSTVEAAEAWAADCRTKIKAGRRTVSEALDSYEDDMRARGLTPGARVLEFALAQATPQEAMTLNLGASSRVYRVRRLRTADGAPLAVESSVLPQERVGELSAGALSDQSLYALLSSRRLTPVRALRHLRAVNADQEQAELLNVRPGAALLMTERVSWSASGLPIEMGSAHYRGDRYDFLMELFQSDSG